MAIRKILYRGQAVNRKMDDYDLARDKSIKNWVFGGLYPVYDDRGIDFIYPLSAPNEQCSVYSQTVGQYTGWKDKNENKIFEDDIVLIDGIKGYFWVEWDSDSLKFVMTNKVMTVDFDNYKGCQIEVVGDLFNSSDILVDMFRHILDSRNEKVDYMEL